MSPCRQSEFAEWKTSMREQHKDLPSKRDVERRHQRMKTTAQNHQYEPEEIQAMVRMSHVGPVAQS